MAYTAADSARMHAHWRAVAKYGTLPEVVWYFDHEPEACAAQYARAHLLPTAVLVGRLLSATWHQSRHLVKELGLPGSHGPRPLGEPLDAWQARLGAARIYWSIEPDGPLSQWVSSARGNYQWLRRLGLALLEEARQRKVQQRRGVEGLQMTLYALELEPPELPDLPQTEPPLGLPPELWIVKDSYIDAIATSQHAYGELFGELLRQEKGALE